VLGAVARIGVDAIQVAPGGKGHARSERRLVEGLAALGRYELVAFVREEGVPLVPVAQAELIREKRFLFWQQYGLPRAARRLGLDAVVTLTDRLPLWDRQMPYVVWLFELPTHRMAEAEGAWQKGSDLFTHALWRRSLRHAAQVVAGSQATARELEVEIAAFRGRLPVVYPGLEPGFAPGEAPAGDRYVFHLGSADPRDNLSVVLEAFRLARERAREPVRLVVGGRVPAWVARDGVELTGYLSDEELARRYRGAAAYLDATLFEGFGYQPLEAMASGAPVVASNASSIPEVVGDAGLLADPRSPDELAEALVRVLDDPALADDLRRRGLERAREFTWERTAREFAAVLDEVLA
jgi:glycosyltransferase involved in cell wall biosynthesis